MSCFVLVPRKKKGKREKRDDGDGNENSWSPGGVELKTSLKRKTCEEKLNTIGS